MQKTKLFVNGRWRDVPVESLHKMLAHGVVGEDTLIIVDDVTCRLGDTELFKRTAEEPVESGIVSNAGAPTPTFRGAVPPPFGASGAASSAVDNGVFQYGQDVKYGASARWIWVVSAVVVIFFGVVVVGGATLAKFSMGRGASWQRNDDIAKNRAAVSAVMKETSSAHEE